MLNLGLVLLLAMVAAAGAFPSMPSTDPDMCEIDPHVNLPEDFVIGYRCLAEILPMFCHSYVEHGHSGDSSYDQFACRGYRCSESCLKLTFCERSQMPSHSVAQAKTGMAQSSNNLNPKLARYGISREWLMGLSMDCRAKARLISDGGCSPTSFQLSTQFRDLFNLDMPKARTCGYGINTFKKLLLNRLPKLVPKPQVVNWKTKPTPVKPKHLPMNYAIPPVQ